VSEARIERSNGVTADTLFVGVTRPALALGVPYAALLLNALVTLELFLVTHNLVWLLVCIPLHGLAWLVCLAEPRFFELLAVWGRIRARAGFGRSHRWRAQSYGCLPQRPARAPAVISAVIVESRGSVPCDAL
jgi:type IV secretion system protein VirB3